MQQGDIFSYFDMCKEEGFALQRGMNYRKGLKISIILMSIRENAPYNDSILEEGRSIIYEGHDIQKNYAIGNDPKKWGFWQSCGITV